MNEDRVSVSGGEKVVFENGTDCYVKMPKENDHIDAVQYFDMHESDCVEENE